MATHPAIAECVALAEDIDKDKTLISLCVILRAQSSADEKELLAFAAENLAKYKSPKKVYFMNSFPRTKNGKVIRKDMLKKMGEQS
jgi:acetyl-CoA synthetase